MAHHVARRIAGSALAILVVLSAASPTLASPIIEFDVTMTHGGENKLVHANTWMPDHGPIRGMLYVNPGTNGDSRDHVESLPYQALAGALGFAMVGMEDRDGLSSQFHGATEQECRGNVAEMLEAAAMAHASPQLINAPIAFYGFSKGAGTSNLLASYMPERTICFITDKNASYTDSINSAAARVPGLFVAGTEDHVVDPDTVYAGFERWRVDEGAEVALGVDWQRTPNTHEATGIGLIAAFISQCTALRYPAGALPSLLSGVPLALNQIDVADGWLIETSYDGGYSWIRSPETAPVASYSLDPATAGWLPSRTMAMVLRGHNASRSANGRRQVDLATTPGPVAVDWTYGVGQIIDLTLTETWVDLSAASAVRIYHDNELIAEYASFPLGGVSVQYTLLEPGVHTFWAEVAYDQNGEIAWATDYAVVMAPIPEPSSAILLACGLLAMGILLLRRRTAPQSR